MARTTSPSLSSTISSTSKSSTFTTSLSNTASSAISSLSSATSSSLSLSTSSSATSTSIPAVSRGPHLYNGGTVAGIVIPIALLSAALAVLATWFLMRRRWSRDPESLDLIAVQPKTDSKAGGAGGHASMINLEDILHQQSDSDTIKNTAETLRDLIKQYVDNYVHTNGVTDPKPCCSMIEGAIDDFLGMENLEESSFLAKSLVNPKTRRDTMRHVIALTFLSSIESSGQLSHSLLPKEVADLARRFPKQESHQEANSLVFSTWRRTTAFLLSPPGAPLAAQSEQGSTMVVEFLERITKPFVDRHNEEREEVFAALVKRTANLGLLLFEQPTAWEFDWKSATSSSGRSHGQQSIVVFPALVSGEHQDGTVAKPLFELTKAVYV